MSISISWSVVLTWMSAGRPPARYTVPAGRSWPISRSRGIDLATVHLHGRDVDGSVTPYFAGFGMRYIRAVPWCFIEHHGMEWVEVVHPHPHAAAARPSYHPHQQRSPHRRRLELTPSVGLVR